MTPDPHPFPLEPTFYEPCQGYGPRRGIFDPVRDPRDPLFGPFRPNRDWPKP